MQFTITVLAAALASVASAAAITKRGAASLTLETSSAGLDGLVYGELIYSQSSVFIGSIKSSTDAEALLLSGGAGGFTFTSFHGSPNGYQSMLIYPTESKPISFTNPHSGSVPAGAAATGFTQDGSSLLFNAEKKWKACPVEGDAGSWQIYWDGAATLTKCVSIDLAVKDNCAV